MDWSVIVEILGNLITSNEVVLTVSVFTNLFAIIALYGLITTLKNELTYYRKTEKSMQEVDQFMIILKNYLSSHYLTIAKDYLGEDYFNHIESHLYNFLIERPLDSIIGEFRRRVRKNGFEKKKPQEWQKYIENCIEEDNAQFRMGLDRVYFKDSILPRVKLLAHNKKITENVNREYKELYDKLLEIANQNPYRKFFKWELRFHYD